MRQLELMGINQLLAVIRAEPHGSALRDRALRRCLDELIEVEIEWRIDYRHLNLGYHNVSTIAPGVGGGTLTGAVDHVGEAAERFRYACRWRHMAKALLGHLNERQRMAVLLTGYKIEAQQWSRPIGGDVERVQAIKQGHRGLTLEEVCHGQRIILQRLGWPVAVDTPFATKIALRDVDIRARAKLLPVVLEQAKMIHLAQHVA